MRLSCPNCAAQYEVPAEAIPSAGRDVQCSACGHTWFEQPPESRPRLLDPDSLEGAPRVEDDEEEADDIAELRVTPPIARPSPPAAAPAPAPVPAAAVPAEAAEPPPPRARVAPEVERILREEAEREARVRAEEAARSLLPDPVPEIARPPRRLRSLDDEDGPLLREAIPAAAPPSPPPSPLPTPLPNPSPARPAQRPARQVDRELDLDRINSTLRSQGDKIGAKAPQLERGPRRRGGGGFLSGFTGALVILGVLAALYVWRADIVAVWPPAARVLDPYASAVDQGRFWLDRELARLLGATSVGL